MKKKLFCITAFTLSFIIGLSVSLSWISYKTVAVSEPRSDKAEIWKRLLSFENKDLLTLTGNQQIKLYKDFFQLVDKDLYVGFGTSIRFEKIVNERNQIRYVLIGADNLIDNDSYQKLSFQIFDKDGNHLNSREYKTNLPFSGKNLKILNLPGFGSETIEVICKIAFPENHAIRQHYALIGDDIQLIKSAQIIE